MTKPQNSAPQNLAELAEFIGETVNQWHLETGRRIDGTNLASRVRRKYPDLDYTSLGIVKLGDAVREAEKRELIIRHRDVQHLEISPRGVGAEVSHARSASNAAFYVRPDIWRAFIFNSSDESTFIHKGTTELESAKDSQTCARLTADADYAKIEPITESLQIRWLRSFLENQNHNSASKDERELGLRNFVGR